MRRPHGLHPLDYIAAGVWINDTVLPLVPKNATTTATIIWRPERALESSRDRVASWTRRCPPHRWRRNP